MEKESSPHSASIVIRNITIGVITSVLAATVIYFLGYNKDEKAEFKKKKEATIKVWGAYQENLRITSALFDKLKAAQNEKDTDIVGLRTKITHEIEASLITMENIKREPNADSRVYSTIDIKAQQFQELLALINKYLDEMYAFIATNPTEAEGQAFLNKLDPETRKQGADIKQRDSLRLATYYDGLNKDYDVVLPLNTKESRGQ
jgi:hypothetical protein